MKAITYHRVSTTDQRPELARGELRGYCARHGWQIVEEIEESASARSSARPGLQRVLELARRRRCDAVVVWRLCRFGRSAMAIHTQIAELESAGVRFDSVSDGIALDPASRSPIARFALSLCAAFAELEREVIVERTRLGLDAARARGAAIGRPRSLNDAQADRIRELRAAGASWADTAEAAGCSIAAARRLLAQPALPKTGGIDLDEGGA